MIPLTLETIDQTIQELQRQRAEAVKAQRVDSEYEAYLRLPLESDVRKKLVEKHGGDELVVEQHTRTVIFCKSGAVLTQHSYSPSWHELPPPDSPHRRCLARMEWARQWADVLTADAKALDLAANGDQRGIHHRFYWHRLRTARYGEAPMRSPTLLDSQRAMLMIQIRAGKVRKELTQIEEEATRVSFDGMLPDLAAHECKEATIKLDRVRKDLDAVLNMTI